MIVCLQTVFGGDGNFIIPASLSSKSTNAATTTPIAVGTVSSSSSSSTSTVGGMGFSRQSLLPMDAPTGRPTASKASFGYGGLSSSTSHSQPLESTSSASVVSGTAAADKTNTDAEKVTGQDEEAAGQDEEDEYDDDLVYDTYYDADAQEDDYDEYA